MATTVVRATRGVVGALLPCGGCLVGARGRAGGVLPRRWCGGGRGVDAYDDDGGDPLWTSHRTVSGAVAKAPVLEEMKREDLPMAGTRQLDPQEYTASPPPAWLRDEAELLAYISANPQLYTAGESQRRAPLVRDFDKEYEDGQKNPEHYRERLLNEIREGQTLLEINSAGHDMFHVDVTGGQRVRNLRRSQTSLRDHLIAERAARLAERAVEADAGENYTLARAQAILNLSDREIQTLAGDIEKCVRYTRLHDMACAALYRERNYNGALARIQNLQPFLGDWWVINDRLKWHGEAAFDPAIPIEAVEGRIHLLEGTALVKLNRTEEALQSLTKAVESYRAAKDEVVEKIAVVRNDRRAALEELTKLKIGIGAYEDALDLADECVGLFPESVEAHEHVVLAMRGLRQVRGVADVEARIAELEAAESAGVVAREMVYNPATGVMEEMVIRGGDVARGEGGAVPRSGAFAGRSLLSAADARAREHAQAGYAFQDAREVDPELRE